MDRSAGGELADALERCESALEEIADLSGAEVVSLAARLYQVRALALHLRAGPGDGRSAVDALRSATRRIDTSRASEEMGLIHQMLSLLHGRLGQPEKARDQCRRALAVFRALGQPRGEASALINLGTFAAVAGDTVSAAGYYAQAAELLEDLGDDVHLALCAHNLGDLAHQEGDLEEAARQLRAARDRAKKASSPWFLPGTLHTLALVELERGDLAACKRANDEAGALAEARGMNDRQARCRALDAALRAIDAAPDDPEPRAALDEAVRTLEEADQAAFGAWARVVYGVATRIHGERADGLAEAEAALANLEEGAPEAMVEMARRLVDGARAVVP